MATFRQIIYTILDEIKSVNGDSYITEEHVAFLANQYRLFLIEQKIAKEGQSSLSSANELTICIDLIPKDIGMCGEKMLESILEIPDIVSGTTPTVYPIKGLGINIAYISEDRMKYVGYNKYLRNIIYCCIKDGHLYLNSSNPLFIYMEKVKLSGVFEDAEEAAKLACSTDESDECPDALDIEFPLSGDMIPLMIELLVKELLNALYRPKDDANNSADDMAELVSYVRRNMKNELSKQLTE